MDRIIIILGYLISPLGPRSTNGSLCATTRARTLLLSKRFRHLHRDLLNLYQRSKTVERPYVAYKGGTIERDLLKKLNIPAGNLEEAGCPKFKRLLQLCTLGSCGQHEDLFRHHCPRVECYHFVQWLRSRLNLCYDTNYYQYVSFTPLCVTKTIRLRRLD